METEKTLERKLAKSVKDVGGWCIKLPSTFVTGLPDRLCLFRGGRICFAEVKGTGLEPTKIQSHIHEKLRTLGFDVFVVDSSQKIHVLVQTYTD